jgi:hypothetical protein
MGGWGTVAKAAHGNLTMSQFAATTMLGTKVYCLGQNSFTNNKIYVYDTVADTWALFATLTVQVPNSYHVFTDNIVKANLLWGSGTTLYALICGTSNGTHFSSILKWNTSTGVQTLVRALDSGTYTGRGEASAAVGAELIGGINASTYWGTDKHKSVVTTIDNRIFVALWTAKKIFEFNTTTEKFVDVGLAWPNALLAAAATRSGPGMFAIGSNLYLVGQSSDATMAASPANMTRGVYEINTQTFTSATKDAFPIPANSSGNTGAPIDAACFAIGNTGIVTGGFVHNDGGGGGWGTATQHPWINSTYNFDPTANTGSQWTVGVALTPRFGHSADVVGSNGFLIGGTVSQSWNGGTYLWTPAVNTAMLAYTYLLDMPVQLKAVYDVPTNAVTLTWKDMSAEESYFTVSRKRDDEAVFTDIGQAASAAGTGTTVTYVDSNITIQQHWYTYKVKCVKII